MPQGDDDNKVEPITAEELAGLSHKELASVKVKKRIMASLGQAPAEDADKPLPGGDDEVVPSPRQRIVHGHEVADRRRKAQKEGGGDGD